MAGSGPCQGDASGLRSGPEVAAALTAVNVHAASGPRAGSTFDANAALGTGPCALLFVHELTRNTAPMIRTLDRLASEYGLLGFHSFTVLLADDRTAAEQQSARSSAALGMRNPIVVSVDGSDGPGGYGLNRKCALTLVLGNQGRVQRAVGLTDTGAQDATRLEGWIVELTGALPTDAAGFSRLLARRYPQTDPELIDLTASLLVKVRKLEQEGPRMRERAERAASQPTAPAAAAAAPADKPRQGRAPDDAELRTLLRAAIQKTASETDLDEVFRRVDARVGVDAALRAQAVDMFKLVLSLGYGTDTAQARARRYVEAHASTPGKKIY